MTILRFTVAPCRHCGRTMRTSSLAGHARTCPDNPAVRDTLRAELDEGDGCIVAAQAYNSEAHPGLPSATKLVAHYGSWRNVAAAMGLRLHTHDEIVAARARTNAINASLGLRDAGTALVDTEGCKRVEHDYTFDGLPVCAVRPLHGGGVAYMVR